MMEYQVRRALDKAVVALRALSEESYYTVDREYGIALYKDTTVILDYREPATLLVELQGFVTGYAAGMTKVLQRIPQGIY